eukprot:NODE_783_length_3906_cov_1.215393.p4 type:complete len:136 gc:universal NODE_783_length_3906_cov_1.215393:2879-2472(-)
MQAWCFYKATRFQKTMPNIHLFWEMCAITVPIMLQTITRNVAHQSLVLDQQQISFVMLKVVNFVNPLHLIQQLAMQSHLHAHHVVIMYLKTISYIGDQTYYQKQFQITRDTDGRMNLMRTVISHWFKDWLRLIIL